MAEKMMAEEFFSRGDSLLHRLHPVIKVIVAFFLTVAIALSWSFHAAILGLATGSILLGLSRLDGKRVLKRMVIVNAFIGFLWLTLPFSYSGTVLWQLGFLQLSQQGVQLTALLTIKANSLVMVLISLLATSKIAAIGQSLRVLGLPEKFCLLLLSSYRYVFVISREYQRLSRAARLRCFVPGTNLHTYRTYGHLFGMTLVRSWNRARRVNQAMLLRGFQGHFYSGYSRNICWPDLVFSGIAAGFGCSIILLNLFFPGMH